MPHHLAQINIAHMKGVNLDDPIMIDFSSRIDEINQIAEQHDGFIWRLKDESGDATNFNPFDNDQLIINMSVWRDISSLHNYVYQSLHKELIRGKNEWFKKLGRPHMAMWWIEGGHIPTLVEAKEKLTLINKLGATVDSFDFKHLYSQIGQKITHER